MLKEVQKEQLKKVLKEGVSSHFIAGGSLLLIKDGKEIFYDEDGYADIEKGVKVKRDSIFRLYSMSKPITAAAVMILLERGEIDLYDPISQYLKGFQNQRLEVDGKTVPVEREIMIKDLLSMTSGLVYGGETPAGRSTEKILEELKSRLYSDSPMNTLEAINRVGASPLAFQPGSYWEYGISADVLGALIEVVSGKKFSEFLKEEIFLPLGMSDTDFWVPEEKRERLVKTYAKDEKGGLEIYEQNHLGIMQKMDRKPAFESGGAGLVSTIDDYAKFANMLMNKGTYNGKEILSKRTVEFLTTSTLNANQQKGIETWQTLCGYSYGNLMRVMVDPTKAGDFASAGEYGWDGWLGAYFLNCPKENLTMLFLMQKTDSGTTPLTRKLRNIIMSSCCE